MRDFWVKLQMFFILMGVLGLKLVSSSSHERVHMDTVKVNVLFSRSLRL